MHEAMQIAGPGFGERRIVFRRELAIVANHPTRCDFATAQEKTPGALALDVFCQPVGRVIPLPIERLPE